jgi:hypothetical protein
VDDSYKQRTDNARHLNALHFREMDVAVALGRKTSSAALLGWS